MNRFEISFKIKLKNNLCQDFQFKNKKKNEE